MGRVDIPDDWDGETYRCYSVKWPDSFKWRSVLNGLIDLAGSGWYYNELTGSVIDARDAIRATWEYSFKNEEVVMTCTDETNASLQGILTQLQRIADKECCTDPGGSGTGGSGGSGSTAQPANPYNQNNTPTVPPPGYADTASYFSSKCSWAGKMRFDLVNDLRQVGFLSLVGATVETIAGLLIFTLATPVPFDELLVIAGSIVSGAITGSLLVEAGSDLELEGTYYTDLLCAFVSAANVSEAYTNAYLVLEAYVNDDTDIPSLMKPYFIDLLASFINVDSLNRLFGSVASSWAASPDCLTCEPTYWYTCIVGEVLEEDSDSVHIGAIEGSYGEYILLINFESPTTFVTSLQNGSITPPIVAAYTCVTTAFDYDTGCSPTCFQAYAQQYPTGVFGTWVDMHTVMYRSGDPFSVLVEI